MSKLIQLIFNYRPGLVGLELTQNICEGRGITMVLWKYLTNKISKIFQNEKPSQTPKNSTIKLIKLGQNIKLKN